MILKFLKYKPFMGMYCKSNCQINPSESNFNEIAENDLQKERKKDWEAYSWACIPKSVKFLAEISSSGFLWWQSRTNFLFKSLADPPTKTPFQTVLIYFPMMYVSKK